MADTEKPFFHQQAIAAVPTLLSPNWRNLETDIKKKRFATPQDLATAGVAVDSTTGLPDMHNPDSVRGLLRVMKANAAKIGNPPLRDKANKDLLAYSVNLDIVTSTPSTAPPEPPLPPGRRTLTNTTSNTKSFFNPQALAAVPGSTALPAASPPSLPAASPPSLPAASPPSLPVAPAPSLPAALSPPSLPVAPPPPPPSGGAPPRNTRNAAAQHMPRRGLGGHDGPEAAAKQIRTIQNALVEGGMLKKEQVDGTFNTATSQALAVISARARTTGAYGQSERETKGQKPDGGPMDLLLVMDGVRALHSAGQKYSEIGVGQTGVTVSLVDALERGIRKNPAVREHLAKSMGDNSADVPSAVVDLQKPASQGQRDLFTRVQRDGSLSAPQKVVERYPVTVPTPGR